MKVYSRFVHKTSAKYKTCDCSVAKARLIAHIHQLVGFFMTNLGGMYNHYFVAASRKGFWMLVEKLLFFLNFFQIVCILPIFCFWNKHITCFWNFERYKIVEVKLSQYSVITRMTTRWRYYSTALKESRMEDLTSLSTMHILQYR